MSALEALDLAGKGLVDKLMYVFCHLASCRLSLHFLMHFKMHQCNGMALLPGRRCESNEMVPKIGFGHLLEYP
jgi:hypothetical protein